MVTGWLLWHWLHLKRSIFSLRVSVQKRPPWYRLLTCTVCLGRSVTVVSTLWFKGDVALLYFCVTPGSLEMALLWKHNSTTKAIRAPKITGLCFDLIMTTPLIVGISLKKSWKQIRDMALPTIAPHWMLDTNGGDSAGPDMAGDAVAAHLQLMGNGRRSAGQMGASQTRRLNAHPVVGNEHHLSGLGDVALLAGGLLGMGRQRRMPLELFGPTALGVACQAGHLGPFGIFVKGSDVELPVGTEISAYLRSDRRIRLPGSGCADGSRAHGGHSVSGGR